MFIYDNYDCVQNGIAKHVSYVKIATGYQFL